MISSATGHQVYCQQGSFGALRDPQKILVWHDLLLKYFILRPQFLYINMIMINVYSDLCRKIPYVVLLKMLNMFNTKLVIH